jgi:hypothetical protein
VWVLVSLNHCPDEALDMAAGLAVLVDPAGVSPGYRAAKEVSVLVSAGRKHLACPRIQPRQAHLAHGGPWKLEDLA